MYHCASEPAQAEQPNLAMRDLRNFANYSERQPKESGIKDLFGGERLHHDDPPDLGVPKSVKDERGQIPLPSFFVSDDNIKFLEQKDPPHQSWLSIFLSEEILYSRMVGIHYAFRQNKI
ncbi:hypothetical protein Tco_1092090 [Tanacetum coccineum]|uniref:Uncharacterized protein n=1 Tax=Tanacetum coccineum TaxID=301880 RepID=A0ABQ5I8V2_9ASTR